MALTECFFLLKTELKICAYFQLSLEIPADLDGPYLIKNDPFHGFEINEGEIKLNSLKANF